MEAAGLKPGLSLFDSATIVAGSMIGSGIFVLRVRRPGAPRPYRAWGYPWVPAAYIVAAVALMADLPVVRPHYTWPGLLIALSAVPVYSWTVRRRDALAAASRRALS